MGQAPEVGGGFPDYLKAAIEAAGFDNPTQFARKAKVEPTVVFAWINAGRRPSIRLIERVAPVLGLDVNALVSAAYPKATGATVPPPIVRTLHPLADELDRMLRADSPLDEEDKANVIVIVNAGMAAARKKMVRRRRAS